MNLEQVATYIREPYTLGLNQVEDLKQLCEDFPYTSVYPLLYLTALSNAKSPALEGALEKYAYRLSDRSRLFDLVSQVSQEAELTTVQETEGETVSIETENETTPEVSHLHIVRKETAETESSQPEITETKEPEPEEQQTDEIIPEKAVEESFEYFTTASSVGQEYFSLEDEEDVENPAEEIEAEIFVQPEAELQPESSEEVAPEQEIAAGPRSFTDWLKSNGSKPAEKEQEKEQVSSKNELIDRFIEKQPSITRQKAEFYSPPKKAKESLNEDAMPVSETLARIFTMQGNYPKAIHVYHQLMLANPEKKTFFAVQIEELKKKLTL